MILGLGVDMSGIIELKDIYKTFTHNGKSFNAVENASVSINKGEIYGINKKICTRE